MPAISALHMLDLMCEQRRWKLRLASTGRRTVAAGVPSTLTWLHIVEPVVGFHPRVRGAASIIDAGSVEKAARALLLGLQAAQRQEQSQ